MAEVVNTSVTGRIAIVRVDNPPVNVLDGNVRAGLKRAFGELRNNHEIEAVILACTGRTFIAGADIKEFDTGVGEPSYHEVFRLIEDSSVPVIAAIHGTALGAGTEVSLACHYRVAAESASLGLPELSLGIIPGAGGTQRLPRLIEFKAAADIMLSAKPVSAARAKELGLVDRVVSGDVIEGATDFAREVIASGVRPQKTRERPIIGADEAAEVLRVKREEIAKTMRNRQSPLKLLEALEAAAELSFDRGLDVEASIGSSLVQSIESRALRHLFFAERTVAKIRALPLPAKVQGDLVAVLQTGRLPSIS